ncbi:duplicated orphan permease [Granulicella rosea]|uniref:Duplicated orphan permease n=1 Tax=Granulicella rosea TaxID=474952 RepID=A0A239DXC8_9BACT|nr:ABC transporter permease [Granulicella rosea]SNS36284.1 duplicated orphan permease [Granulicella rosea]
MESALKDLRYAFRQLLRSPGFALTAILTLALGIGANTAIFSLLDQALLRTLPVRDPGSLVVLEDTGRSWKGSMSDHGGDQAAYFSYPMYKDLRDKNQALDGLLATSPTNLGFLRNGSSKLVSAEVVTGNYFTVLGVGPALGRVLTQADDLQKNGSPVAVLSYDFWKNFLGADPGVVGSNVSINGQPFQIVGVAAQGFHSAIWGENPNVFVPMCMVPTVLPSVDDRLTARFNRWLNIVGRLKPGHSRAQAEASIDPLWHALRAEELKSLGTVSPRFTKDFLGSRMRLLPGARGFSYQRENFQKPLLAVMGMSLLVLIIASVNVASLLLVRSASRGREFSLRFALGAEASRVAQQLLIEGLLIGVAGGAVGMLFAPLAIRALVSRLAGDQTSVAFTTEIDLRLLAFNFGIALGVSVLFSLAPILQLRKPDLTLALRQQSGTSTGGMLRLRRVVVCLQIGLSVVLLVAAGLFARTMQQLRAVDVGFNTAHLATFHIDATLAGYKNEQIPAIYQRVIEMLAALPGTQGVAATNDAELAGTSGGGSVEVTGYVAPPDTSIIIEAEGVNTGYFAALQVPLLTGRLFTDGDTVGHPLVAVVNESFAKTFCGGVQTCVGKISDAPIPDVSNNRVKVEIVGVVRDAKHLGVRDPVKPTLFAPLRQYTVPSDIYLYVRTTGDPAQELTVIRKAMHQLDPALALDNLRTMDTQIDDNLQNDRMIALLAIAFGALATLLAGVGLYGVLAYSIAQRTREIGLRIALGSSRLAVVRLVLTELMRLAALGIVIAIPLAFGLSKLVQSQLFGVSAADPSILLSVTALISLVALVAALIPARRAASVQPIIALRTE